MKYVFIEKNSFHEKLFFRLNCLYWSHSRVKFHRIEETADEKFCSTTHTIEFIYEHMNIIISIYKNKASIWGNSLVLKNILQIP